MNPQSLAEVEITFGGAVPVFPVRELPASIDYYVNVLGFAVNWQTLGTFASLSRDRCILFLCVGDQGNPGAWAWIGVKDVELLFAQYQSRGAHIRQPPTNFSWACEIQIADPDGNILRFGSDPKPDQPFGPWLDMRGTLWNLSAAGEWTRAGN